MSSAVKEIPKETKYKPANSEKDKREQKPHGPTVHGNPTKPMP